MHLAADGVTLLALTDWFVLVVCKMMVYLAILLYALDEIGFMKMLSNGLNAIGIQVGFDI